MRTLSARTKYALLGLAVGLGCAGFIVFRLHQATTPMPTIFEIINTKPSVVHVDRVLLGKDKVLASQLTILGAMSAEKSASYLSDPEPLSAGMPITLSATVSGQSTAQTCTLEPRPQGKCLVRAQLTDGTEMKCEYECKVPAAQ